LNPAQSATPNMLRKNPFLNQPSRPYPEKQ